MELAAFAGDGGWEQAVSREASSRTLANVETVFIA
jgi:hypothetical protein